jgi:hypothetical protein
VVGRTGRQAWKGSFSALNGAHEEARSGTMTLTRESLDQGMTYQAFKDQMTRNQERFSANEARFRLEPAEQAVFDTLPGALRVLVLAEDWCGDVIDNLPILGRIAQETGKLDLCVFLRDQRPELMDQYLNEGKYRSIPVFVFFDQNLQELGRFIERTRAATERRAQFRQAFFAQHPEYGSVDTPIDQLSEEARSNIQQAMAEKRLEWKPVEEREVAQAIVAIVARASR